MAPPVVLGAVRRAGSRQVSAFPAQVHDRSAGFPVLSPWHRVRVDAAPLLAVPGVGLDEAAWRPTLLALRPRPGTVALLPAYGARPGAEPLDPAALGARLVNALDDNTPRVLLGHSGSCQIVAHAAARAGAAVSALVLAGPTPAPAGSSWPALAGGWLRTAAHERPGQLPPLVRTYTQTGPVHMLRAVDEARRDDIRATLRRVSCPVLVVRG